MSDLGYPAGALITGGTRGLGRALSQTAARAGCEVLALYRGDEDAALSLAEAGGSRIRCMRHDVTQSGFPQPPEASPLVFIHAAAAPFLPTPMHLINPEAYLAQWQTSVLGFVHGLRVVLRPMVRAGGGTVVAVLTSALTENPPKGFSAYTSAKLALEGLVQSVAAEYAVKGIRAFCVAPGFMATQYSAHWDPALRDAVRQAQPGGAQDPVAVAEWIWALLGDPGVPGHGETHLFPQR